MVRTQVYLDERQVRRLRRLASATGKSQSQLIRDAVDRLDAPEDSPAPPSEATDVAASDAYQLRKSAVLDRIAGAWASNDTDFAAIRREWDERIDSQGLFGRQS